ncbi:MAG: translation initiation factor IF-2 N-terminal domain-containing protein, partial [Oscillospiraceae bacterium]|nr:translation initiation factor IF-2 N-terminal domain-containing protein [Oscillospiraceae bacterium]
MGKVKIHEIAKRLELNSKDVLEKASELGIEAKTHLSGVSEEEARKLEANLAEARKEAVKKDSPVIIRRAVVRVEEEPVKEKEVKAERTPRKDVGFVETDRKKDFNIVYRDKPNKPLSINELFGKKTEAPEQVEQETRTAEPVVAPKPTEKSGVEENRPRPERPVRNDRPFNNNQGPRPGYNNQQNRLYNNNRPFNRDGANNNRPYNNNYNNNRGQEGRPYNNNYNNNNYNNRNNNFGQRRPLDDRGIEKNIKNIMGADVVEKESVREFSNRN